MPKRRPRPKPFAALQNRDRKGAVIAPLGFLIVSACWVALLYAKSVNSPFVYDDVLVIQNNPALSSWHDIIRYFRSPVELNNDYRGFAGSIYRPLTWLGFVINHKLSGSSTIGFHITNLLLHWGNGVIGFFLLRKLRLSPPIAAATCLIWLGLPISSEAVAWISGRHTCQATFFILLSLLAAVCYLREKRPLLLTGYCAALLAALLSNESAILALPLTALFGYIERPNERSTWLSLGASAVGVTSLAFAMRQAAGAHLPTGPLKILPEGLSFFEYLRWIVLPVGMSVERSTDTPSNQVTISSLTALAALCCVLIFALNNRKQLPRLSAGLAWLLVCLLPFCGIVFIYQGMAERYTYLASAGLVFCIVVLVDLAKLQIRPIAFSLVLLWVVWGAWRLNARLLDWSDQTRLFKASLQTDPDSPVLLYNLGIASAETGDVEKAVSYYRRALSINPNYLNVLVNLGNLLRDEGNYPEALAAQQRAITVGPQTADLWVNLGDTYLKRGSLDQAKEAFQKAISLDKKSIEATVDLGAVFQSTGQFAAAKEQYERAISIDPHAGAAYCNLGALFLKQGDVNAALDQFKKATQADPSYSPAYRDLALVYESTGRKDLAIPAFEKVLQLKPDDTDAALHLRGLTEH